jgi:hypothetical protein
MSRFRTICATQESPPRAASRAGESERGADESRHSTARLTVRTRPAADADDAGGSRRRNAHVVISLNDERGRFDARIGVAPRYQWGCRNSPCGDRRAAGDSVHCWATRAEPRRVVRPVAGCSRCVRTRGSDTTCSAARTGAASRIQRLDCRIAGRTQASNAWSCRVCVCVCVYRSAADGRLGVRRNRGYGVSATAGRSSAGDAPRPVAAQTSGRRLTWRRWAGRTVSG